jgi:endonuclease YncB( thermonuclease family)
MFRNLGLSTALLISFAAFAAAQSSYPGQVIDVIDGKTVVVDTSNGRVKVGLQYIDVPGTGQVLHDTVKTHLRDLVLGKLVSYTPRMLLTDRTIGQLVANDIDISQQMLRDGAAWHIPANVSGQSKIEHDLYASFESAAKKDHLGVWAVPGLKPEWETRAENRSAEPKLVQKQQIYEDSPVKSSQKSAGRWSDKNPRLGSVGALLSGYNAESKTGFLSTTLFSLETDKNSHESDRMAIDITYLYKENDRKGRTGSFILTLVGESHLARFATQNDLWVYGGGNPLNLGPAKRAVYQSGTDIREKLTYVVKHDVMKRIVNNDEVFMRVNNQFIKLTGIRFMLYNMLEVAG